MQACQEHQHPDGDSPRPGVRPAGAETPAKTHDNIREPSNEVALTLTESGVPQRDNTNQRPQDRVADHQDRVDLLHV